MVEGCSIEFFEEHAYHQEHRRLLRMRRHSTSNDFDSTPSTSAGISRPRRSRHPSDKVPPDLLGRVACEFDSAHGIFEWNTKSFCLANQRAPFWGGGEGLPATDPLIFVFDPIEFVFQFSLHVCRINKFEAITKHVAISYQSASVQWAER
jgi:hypothetical protein